MEKQEAIHHIPASLEAEQAVLGSILINPDAIKAVANKLVKDDFFRERHGWLWESMVALHERHEPIDFVTLVEELDRRKLLQELGGPAFITDLISTTPTALYLDHYLKIVKDKAARRRLIGTAQKLAELAYNEDLETAQMFDQAESLLFATSSRYQSRETRHIREIMDAYFERLDAEKLGGRSGVPTGFNLLDRILGGLQRSDLIVLAGRPGMGKTALALTILDNAAKLVDAHCALFSIEMSAEQCAQRLLSMNTSIDSHRLRTGDVGEEEWQAMLVAANDLTNAQIFIDDTPSISLAELCGKARRLHAEYGLNLIVIDYLQLIVGSTDGRMTREQEISKISRTLKALARELDVPVLVLAQLSRAVEQRSDKRPALSDLRECVVGGTLLVDANTGRQVPIRTVKAGDMILGMGKDQKIRPYRVNDVWSTGEKQVYTMTTQTGRSVTCSANHPFLAAAGWKKLEELQPGDTIATAMNMSVNGDPTDRASLCRFLGYMAGNGSMQKHRCIAFCGSDEQQIEDITRIVSSHFPKVVWRERRKTPTYTDGYFACVQENGYGKPNGNPLIQWLKTIGLLGCRDSNKFVPDFVFEAGAEGAREFVAGYFATDGCVKKGRDHRWAAHFDTTSHQLALGVQSLLLRLGIVASIGKASFNTKSTKPLWRLNVIQCSSNLKRFAELITPPGRKGMLLQQMLMNLPASKTSAGLFGLPAQVSTLMSEKINAHTRSGAKSEMHWRDQGKRPNRENCLKVAKALGDADLATWGNSDLLWEQIVSITYAGVEETFDINTACSTFVGNGIVAHNSGAVEQDSDVVLFVYREDYYEPDSERQNIADILVAKHRHGATGDVSVYFRKELTQFRDLEIERIDLDGPMNY